MVVTSRPTTGPKGKKRNVVVIRIKGRKGLDGTFYNVAGLRRGFDVSSFGLLFGPQCLCDIVHFDPEIWSFWKKAERSVVVKRISKTPFLSIDF